MRFTDVQTKAQPIQPIQRTYEAIPVDAKKAKNPKKGRSGDQEMGVV